MTREEITIRLAGINDRIFEINLIDRWTIKEWHKVDELSNEKIKLLTALRRLEGKE